MYLKTPDSWGRLDSMANYTYAALAILHVAFAISLMSAPDIQLTLTLRRQFDDWGPLLDLYRSPSAAPNTSEAMYARAMELSWCAAPLPRGTLRSPYCACVTRRHIAFVNASAIGSKSAVQDAVMGLVSCLSSRPVWRVRPVWGVQYCTPAIYALFVSACFLWVAAGFGRRWTSIPMWGLALAVAGVFFWAAPVRNGLWVITVLLVGVLIEWVLLPGLSLPPDAAALARQQFKKQVDLSPLRLQSCFWWCEYISSPVFALYVPLMHCGRDLVMTGVMVMLGGAVGGLGLRSFWCSQAYRDSEGFRSQFRGVMQAVVWLGIFAASSALLCLTAVYYDNSSRDHYGMGVGSIALLCLTISIGLMQWPGAQAQAWVLPAQSLMAFARNVTLFAVVLGDVR